MQIKIERPEGYEVAPRGVAHFFPAGTYSVPGDMSVEIARRCVASGVGKEIADKRSGAAENKGPGATQNKGGSSKKKSKRARKRAKPAPKRSA